MKNPAPMPGSLISIVVLVASNARKPVRSTLQCQGPDMMPNMIFTTNVICVLAIQNVSNIVPRALCVMRDPKRACESAIPSLRGYNL